MIITDYCKCVLHRENQKLGFTKVVLSRRDFIFTLAFTVSKWGFSSPLFAATKPFKPIHVVLPPKPKQIHYKEGAKKGGGLLIIGGIHGNEPGAYKAVDILSRIKLKQGKLVLIPRSNFTSILANMRGYNGDMNRKFAFIKKNDPDYPWVSWLKKHILQQKVDAVLSLHDGAGFHLRNKSAWGECIVIDEVAYQGWPLYRIAYWVINQVNRHVFSPLHKFAIYNTHTFSSHTKHAEQRKSLTFFTLTQAHKPAFCLEVSKQLPSLSLKVMYHLSMLKYFFKIYQIETDPPLDMLISHIDEYLVSKPCFTLALRVNDIPVQIYSDKTLTVPAKAELKIEEVKAKEGVFITPQGVNLNWTKFRVYNKLTLEVKYDFQTLAKIKFKVV
ncbi:M99 family carboxypeptidase catalytic domain-containing protein [Desulfonauticus submarinus]